MYAVLSPAKRLSVPDTPVGLKVTKPQLMKHTEELAARAKKYTRADLRRLMNISQDLADLNFQRFQAFEADTKGASPAALVFNGDVYQGLKADTLSTDDLAFAQEHIGILSGLYGLLRPLDGMHPYRLEMGTSVNTARGEDLYDFWKPEVTKLLNKQLKKSDAKALINLASNEYFSAVDASSLNAPVITPVFKDVKDGKARVLSFFAKKARGTLARAIITKRIVDPEILKKTSVDGYRFKASLSDDTTWVFSRPQPAKKQ